MQQGSGSTNSSCVQNYKCFATTANTPAAQATVGLVIADLYQCTGTLINDVPQDNAPYVLTARHCESGQLGGGNPGAAASVTVYWDAVSACGSALGTLYDPGIPTQTGSITEVEQQDAWLIRLDESPVVSDAQVAGFDASGGAVQGGFTIHHALGFDKQFTTWFGSAYAVQDSGTLGVNYVSNFWETVNATGNVGPGASGSGLFNQNNVLVGSASLGRSDGDSSGYESCPNPTPSPPNGSNGAADFTQLSAVWNSLADPTSSTGSTTVQSILDPADTGTLTVSSAAAASMTFTASTYSLAVNSPVTLTWNAPGATQCTASGGGGVDGWGGTVAGAGSQAVTEGGASTLNFLLSCPLSAGRTVSSSVEITWGSPQTLVSFTGSVAAWTTTPATLKWTSTVAPCSINGGTLSAGDLPSSGSITTTEATPGDVVYGIQCGAGSEITSSWPVSYVTPSVELTANSTDRQLGQPLSLSWITAANVCTPSGGAPNDGWSLNNFSNPLFNTGFSPTVTTAGTYTYTLTCSSGALSIAKSVTVTIETNPGYATLSIQPTSVTFSDSPADVITLAWASNLTACTLNSQPLVGGETISNPNPDGLATWAPAAPGTYSFSVTCNPFDTTVGGVTSSAVSVTVLTPPAPTATMSISPSTVQAGQNFVVSWSTTYAQGCAGTGSAPPGFLWPTTPTLDPSGSMTANSQSPGQYTFGVSCPSIVSGLPNATAQATVTITGVTPTATLSASPTSLQTGQSLTLTWSSTAATACTASGGGANGSTWSGTLDSSGSVTQTASVTGSFTYTVSCSDGSQSAQAHVSVDVSAAPGSSGSSSGGSGGKSGGGSVSLLELGALLAILGIRQRGSAGGRGRGERGRPCPQ